MTIKPINNQKSSEKKENHSHQESQNQNLVVPNVRTNHRNANKPNGEVQTSKTRSDVFDDLTRQRRSPHKSSNVGRSKRDHHKREQRDREKVSSSPQYHATLSVCNSPHASSSTSKSPKHGNNATAATQPTKSLVSFVEETFSGYNSGDEHLTPKETLLTPDEWKNRDEQFIKAMSERGLIIQDIVEDGACLFRSISLQIYGDQEMHETIRQQTMDYIYQNREYFAHFVTEDITSYVKRKRSTDSHGNHIEIQAMSEIYNRPVELYCYQTTPINIFNSEQINNGYDPLRLSYQRGSHYNAIIDPYNATVGVGLGLAGYKPESQTREAIRLSEQLEIEKTMFEDKLKTTDWEATNEAIEEQIARESYLQWCRENMQNVQKSSPNSTSSTVTSAEAGSDQSTDFTPSVKEQLQYHVKGADGSCNNDSILEEAPVKTNINISAECCESDDTDMSSASSGDHYIDKLHRIKTVKVGSPRRIKRRHKVPETSKSGASTVGTVDVDSSCPPKRTKQTKRRLPPPSPTNPAATNYLDKLPCTSKQATQNDQPLSSFYQSLLESSYADDGIGQLSENEMVMKAIKMSRMDFLENQKRKIGDETDTAQENTATSAEIGDDDSDTTSQ